MRPGCSRALSALLAGVALQCAPKGSSKHPYTADPTAAADLLEADRAFNDRTTDRGLDGWVDSFTEDGMELPNGEPVARGKAAIRAVMTPLLSDPTNKLRWEPEYASVAASGDLGYTFGHATIGKVGPSGVEKVFLKLKYIAIWKRQPDGQWRVAVDVGTADPP